MIALVDDQLLGAVLRGDKPDFLDNADLYTTGCWYVRLCQAVLGTHRTTGVLSTAILSLPPTLREKALSAVMELPDEIGLISLRTLGPRIGQLRRVHAINILAIEALAAAQFLGAEVYLSAPAPQLQIALDHEALAVHLT